MVKKRKIDDESLCGHWYIISPLPVYDLGKREGYIFFNGVCQLLLINVKC